LMTPSLATGNHAERAPARACRRCFVVVLNGTDVFMLA
jgi:hypothetical protein